MDQQNIDRLFREKLGQMEVKPSANAWSKVEKQIRPNKTPMIYWVAASVSLLLITWIVWPEATTEHQFTQIASEVNAPTQVDMPEFVMPAIDKEDEKPKEDRTRPVRKRPLQTQFVSNQQEAPKMEKVEEQMPVMEAEAKTMVASAEIDAPETLEDAIEVPNKTEYKAIKITYIASASGSETKEDIQKTDSTGVLKKFIAFAEKIDPGDMLADIKTAKDNLLNGGLKKKERSSL
ncbi:hypothetical protein [Ekhidna sp.]|uniref:hypothetical protein n=1 Tax=Ekhidna sp. TaxID=2608089 RepID=UPI003B5920C5